MKLFHWLSLAGALFTAPLGAQGDELDPGPEVDLTKNYYAMIYTSKGRIPVDLFQDIAPQAVQNFVNLSEGTREFKMPGTGEVVKRPLYRGIQFHRVIPSFMAQTGDITATGRWRPGYTFDGEFDPDTRFDKPGMLGMANPGDPNGNSSQFFITEVPTPHLNDKHTIFGEVISPEGLEVLKAITSAERGQNDQPKEPIYLERVEIYRLEADTDHQTALAAMEPEA